MSDFSTLSPYFYINEHRKLEGIKLELFKGNDKIYDVLSGKSKIDNGNISYLCGVLGMSRDYWLDLQEKYDMNKENNPDIEINYSLLSDMMYEILCLGKIRKPLREDGYLDIYSLIEDINEQEVFDRNINYFDILTIVNNSIHIIYQMDNDKIRALYGHKKELNINTNLDIPDQYVYLLCNKERIKNKEIFNNNETDNNLKYYSNLKKAYEDKREDEAILFVDTKRALKKGIRFKLIGSRVWNSTGISKDALLYEDFFNKGLTILEDDIFYEDSSQCFFMGCKHNDVRCQIGAMLCELNNKSYEECKRSVRYRKDRYNNIKRNAPDLIVRNEEVLLKRAHFQVEKYRDYVRRIKVLVKDVEELKNLGDNDSDRLIKLLNKINII